MWQGGMMGGIAEFLNQADYKNYRNVRAAALMFIVLGCLIGFCGIIFLTVEPQPGHSMPPIWVALLLLLLGASAVVGGVAAIAANPTWSRLVYVMAVLYVLAFPLGTILSFIMFTGLSKHVANVQRYRAARGSPAAT
jgi:Na+/alanine symporter